MENKIVALDIGGTSIKSGLWCGGELTEVREWDTNAQNGGSYVMERVKEILRGYRGYRAIGISTAGQVDSKKGRILYANENIPGYTGMPVREILEREFAVPAAVENDVNAAALGEARFGAGIGRCDFLCITYGTGVGGAIVINGEVYTGGTFSAGEFGGIIVHPEDREAGSPFSGCYEKYASTTALVRMVEKYDGDLDSGRKIFERLSEPGVYALVDVWIDEIVYGLITLIHIFNPSCIILGGGVMAQPHVIRRIREKTQSEIMDSFRGVELLPAGLGNRAGLLGAAWLASRLCEEKNVNPTIWK